MSIFKRFRDNQKEILYLPEIQKFEGEVHIIGSKSIANRVILLASMCEEKTILKNVPNSEDVQVLLANLPKMGVEIQKSGKQTYQISGKTRFSFFHNYFHLKNAGTALRPLIAIISTQNTDQEIIIDGNEQMRRRPVFDLAQALSKVGVDIKTSQKGTPPVRIRSYGWKKNQIFISGKTSSQFISALLMAAPLTEKEIEIFVVDEIVSKPYIDLTIRMMEKFSVSVIHHNYTYFKIPEQRYRSPKEFWIEGDATAATYFFTAGMLSGPVTVHGLNSRSIQGDIQYLELIRSMGGEVEELSNSIRVKNQNTIRGLSVDMNAMPDAAMTLAITGLFSSSPVEIFNVANLRVKESERLYGLSKELQKFGAIVEERKDGLKVYPPEKIQKPRIETYQDHRMAMAFSLGCWITDVEIIDPDCVQKTYPNYFLDFERICRN